MREALWRLCLWWVCLAAAARVATPAVAAGAVAEVATEAGGQGECEVLDLSEASPGYALPTALTLRPSEAGWRLDVTLGRGAEAAVCVQLEDKLARLRVTALAGGCDGGDVRDHSYLNVSVPLGVWTSLRVDVAASNVTVSAPNGISTSVATRGAPLPRDSTQVALTGARSVEAAVGCPTNCPGYRHASPAMDKKVTVREWPQDSVHFYFRPGNAFVKLEYEVACTTPLGNKMFPPVSDITLDSNLPRWHQADLHHGSGLATVSLDNMPLKSKTLPEGCTFKKHKIKVMGEGVFSFTCNPFNGEVECIVDEGGSVMSVATTQARMPDVAIAVITIGSIIVVLLLITVFWLVKRKPQSEKPSNETDEKLRKYHLLEKNYQQLEKDYQKLEKDHQQLEKDHQKLEKDHQQLKKNYEQLGKEGPSAAERL